MSSRLIQTIMVFREAPVLCPGCQQALPSPQFAVCESCGGAWVAEAELEARMRQMRSKSEFNLALAFSPSDEAPRSVLCPMCREPLAPAALGQVLVDRCARWHGIWFDEKELAAVLLSSVEGAGVRLRPVTLDEREQAAMALASAVAEFLE